MKERLTEAFQSLNRWNDQKRTSGIKNVECIVTVCHLLVPNQLIYFVPISYKPKICNCFDQARGIQNNSRKYPNELDIYYLNEEPLWFDLKSALFIGKKLQ